MSGARFDSLVTVKVGERSSFLDATVGESTVVHRVNCTGVSNEIFGDLLVPGEDEPISIQLLRDGKGGIVSGDWQVRLVDRDGNEVRRLDVSSWD
jgi:hypothetical protein